jgi:hypothetical protein
MINSCERRTRQSRMMVENRKAKVEVKLDQPQLARRRYVAVRQVVL